LQHGEGDVVWNSGAIPRDAATTTVKEVLADEVEGEAVGVSVEVHVVLLMELWNCTQYTLRSKERDDTRTQTLSGSQLATLDLRSENKIWVVVLRFIGRRTGGAAEAGSEEEGPIMEE